LVIHQPFSLQPIVPIALLKYQYTSKEKKTFKFTAVYTNESYFLKIKKRRLNIQIKEIEKGLCLHGRVLLDFVVEEQMRVIFLSLFLFC
jgi:hypothetical protein